MLPSAWPLGLCEPAFPLLATALHVTTTASGASRVLEEVPPAPASVTASAAFAATSSRAVPPCARRTPMAAARQLPRTCTGRADRLQRDATTTRAPPQRAGRGGEGRSGPLRPPDFVKLRISYVLNVVREYSLLNVPLYSHPRYVSCQQQAPAEISDSVRETPCTSSVGLYRAGAG